MKQLIEELQDGYNSLVEVGLWSPEEPRYIGSMHDFEKTITAHFERILAALKAADELAEAVQKIVDYPHLEAKDYIREDTKERWEEDARYFHKVAETALASYNAIMEDK